jgi:MFS family permease
MLGMQFISALAVNHLPYRKKVWITVLVIRRALVVLLALIPWVLPGGPGSLMVWTFIALAALGQCMGTLGHPIFFSWMGDLLPRATQTEFWASRRKWLSWTGAGAMLVVAGFFYYFKAVDIRITYLVVAVIGSTAGVIDILLFIKIPERRAELSPDPHYVRIIEPFRDKGFRRLIAYASALTFGTMLAAPFFRVFLLKEIGLGVHLVVLLFTVHSVGGTFFARSFGRVADRLGHRPVIVLCSALKSLIAIAMAAIQPGWWVLILVPVMLFDNMLNTGLQASRTGFMLKQSPAQNRAMFVAAVLSCAGLAGAAGSLTGGFVLKHLPADGLPFLFGSTLSTFRTVFLLSAFFRMVGFAVSLRLHEPGSKSAPTVLMNVVRPAAIRWLQAPWLAVFRPGANGPNNGNDGR